MSSIKTASDEFLARSPTGLLRRSGDTAAGRTEWSSGLPFPAEVCHATPPQAGNLWLSAAGSYTAARKWTFTELRRTMKPTQVQELPFVPRIECSWDPLWRRLETGIVVEMTALDLKCGKLSGLHHLVQFGASETDRRLSTLVQFDSRRIAGGRTDRCAYVSADTCVVISTTSRRPSRLRNGSQLRSVRYTSDTPTRFRENPDSRRAKYVVNPIERPRRLRCPSRRTCDL